MHALSVSESCADFGSNDCKVVLKLRKGYVPTELSTQFRAQVITLSAFPPSEAREDPPPQPLCPVRALRNYVECTRQFRLSKNSSLCVLVVALKAY